MKVALKPITLREKFVTERFGCDDWEVIKEEPMICFQGRIGVQVIKNGHLRNILKEQVVFPENKETQNEQRNL